MHYFVIKRFIKQTIKVMRVDDPRPSMFLFWPCAWGVFFAKGFMSTPVGIRLTFFAIACFLMYIFACITNDVVDRKFDAMIPRTKDRLIAAGKYSIPLALFIAGICALISLKILLLFNKVAVSAGFFGVAIACIYPFCKRFTHYVAFILGFAANIGVLIGYASLAGFIGKSAVLLYIGGVYWTAVYDSIYGFQDREFDKNIGLKSLGVLYGNNIKQRLRSYLGMMFLCMALAGFLDPFRMNIGYYIILALGVGLSWKTLENVDLEDKASCNAALGINSFVGGVIAFACYVGRLN